MNWIDDQTLYNSEKSLKNEIRIFGIISIILLIKIGRASCRERV